MSPIKLYKVSESEDGTEKFQSQLMLGRDAVDFIRKDGVMCCWGRGDRGFDFYSYDEEYEIVDSIEDMRFQKL